MVLFHYIAVLFVVVLRNYSLCVSGRYCSLWVCIILCMRLGSGWSAYLITWWSAYVITSSHNCCMQDTISYSYSVLSFQLPIQSNQHIFTSGLFKSDLNLNVQKAYVCIEVDYLRLKSYILTWFRKKLFAANSPVIKSECTITDNNIVSCVFCSLYRCPTCLAWHIYSSFP